jgi:type II secretory pathway predicted ATPase ExeA
MEEARLRLVRAIARSEGPAIVVGAAGVGKSMLLAVLAEQFATRRAVVTLMGAQLCTRRALLQMILCELGLPYRDMDEGELRLSILEHLRGIGTMPANRAAGGQEGAGRQRVAATPMRLVLLVDEADTLPIRLLEELRVLTNVSAAGMPLVSLVLAGGPNLEERFADPQLDMFSQRIGARCYLAPLSREETIEYVRAQVAAAGVQPESLFTTDALEAIFSATGGVPRVVNQLGDQLAWMAEETGCTPLDAALVQQAWSELQQLPAPWNVAESASAPASAAGGLVEFGELDAPSVHVHDVAFSDDEGDDELPASIPIAAARSAKGGFEEFDDVLDATEQLLASYDEGAVLELCVAEPAAAEAPPLADDPFDEVFDEEEIVLDPYAAFEADLFRGAPQVVNRLDRAFAGQLYLCLMSAAPAGRPALKPHDERQDAAPPATTSPPVDRAAVESIAAASGGPVRGGASPRVAEDVVLAEPLVLHGLEGREQPEIQVMHVGAGVVGAVRSDRRELLQIEDDDRPSAAIVPGRQFRRLFSSLESAAARALP